MGGTGSIVPSAASSRSIIGIKDKAVTNIHEEFTARPVHAVSEGRAVVGDANKDAGTGTSSVENHGPNLGTMPTVLIAGDHQPLDGDVLDADLTTANPICAVPDAKIDLVGVGRLVVRVGARTT